MFIKVPCWRVVRVLVLVAALHDLPGYDSSQHHWRLRTARLMLSAAGDEEADADSIGRSSGIAQQLLRGSPTAAEGHAALRGAGGEGAAGSERSFRCEAGASEAAAAFRLGRHVRKKLQQIEALERRRGTGGALDEQQVMHTSCRRSLPWRMQSSHV